MSVKNGKVYIGKASTAFNPAFGMQAINLVLSRSGHRDKNTQQLKIDIDYDKTHRDILEDVEARFIEEVRNARNRNPGATKDELIDSARYSISDKPEVRNWEIVIPIEEVQSANVFEVDIYDLYFAPKKGKWERLREKLRGYLAPYFSRFL